MRFGKAPSREARDEDRERYLGAIAPLLDAARRLESLAPDRKRRVRRRIMRSAFGTRRLPFRLRMAPVLTALAALVVGGAAFAMAERLGLIPSVRSLSEPEGAPTGKLRSGKRRLPLGSSSVQRVLLPESPDPLVLPIGGASTVGWLVMPDGPGAEAHIAADLPGAGGTHPTTVDRGNRARAAVRRTAVRPLAYAAPVPVTPAPPLNLAPASSVPAPATSAGVGPAGPSEPRTVSAVYVPRRPTLPPAAPTALAPTAASSSMPAYPRAPATVDLHSVPSDSLLFGQAMRKLRVEHNPASALTALQEHAHAYPRSNLSAERSALEVEALLALHRDHDALLRLDSMALDELPRSGERFVVRGELRAVARRWLEASADFDRALARVSGSPAWHERALWGRAVARLRCGEREAGLADIERYRDRYPDGRFAAEAARFLLAR